MSSHTRSLRRWTQLLTGVFCVLTVLMVYLIWSDTRQSQSIAPIVDANRIRIQRTGFDDIQLSKRDNVWQLDAPCSIPANQQRLEPLLSALAPGGHQYTTSDVDLEAAGLIAPLAVVHINEIEHRIGNTDLNGDRRYVQRGKSVVFVPEWILSLVNGGVTALASLEVFPEPLGSMQVLMADGSSVTLDNAEALDPWQILTAQQIVSWPLPEDDASNLAEATFTLQPRDLQEQEQEQEQTITVHEGESFIALHRADAECAYILPAESLPEITQPN